MNNKKEVRCVHKERIILLWVVFAVVLLFVLASPNTIFEYQKVDLIQESFASLVGSGNVLTGAVIGVQDYGIQSATEGSLNVTFNFSLGGDYTPIAIVEDSDGNIFVAGTGSNLVDGTSATDGFVRKFLITDASEDLLWNLSWSYNNKESGTESGYDDVHAIAIDSLDNIYVIGDSNVSGEIVTTYIKKFNSDGIEDTATWDKELNVTTGSAIEDNEVGWDIEVDSNNNVYVAGYYSGDAYLKSFNSNGVENSSWNFTTAPGDGSESRAAGFRDIQFDSSENLYAIGYWYTPGGASELQNWTLWKFDQSTGNESWNVSNISETIDEMQPYALALDSSDNVYVVGYYDPANDNNYEWLIKKFDSSGVEIVTGWNKTFTKGASAKAEAVRVDSNDNIFVLGKNGAGFPSGTGILKQFESDGTEDETSWNLSTRSGPPADEKEILFISSNNNVFILDQFSFTEIAITQYEGEAAGTDCGTITTDTTMDQNVTTTATCFSVTANDVTLDCAGYLINFSTTTPGSAITITDQDNITIKNCVIEEGATSGTSAINIDNSVNITIQNNSIITYGAGVEGVEYLDSNNSLIINNTITTTNNAYTLSMSGQDTNITNNTLTATDGIGIRVVWAFGTRDYYEGNTIIGNPLEVIGIDVDGSNNTFFNNDVFVDGITAFGVRLSSSDWNLLDSNNLTATNTEGIGIKITGTSDNNTLLNNNITASIDDEYDLFDETGSSYNNSLIYNNSFGTLNWTNTNLTTKTNLTMGVTIFLEENNVGFQHEDQDGKAQELNGSAEIEIYGLTAYTSTPQLLKNDVRCDNTDACNISFDATNDILYANVSSFSNYTTSLSNVDCGTITTDTTMDQNVTTTATCFSVTANDVTLDCAGYLINFSTTTPGSAITITDQDNITIKNCVIEEGATSGTSAINIDNSVNITIQNNSIITYGAGVEGVEYLDSNNSLIINNTITTTNNAYTLSMSGQDTNITNNTLTATDGIGIRVVWAFGTRDYYEGNTIIGNPLEVIGIDVDGSNNTFFNNDVFVDGITAFGVRLSSSDWNLLDSNNLTATNTEGIGIKITGTSDNNTLLNNNITATTVDEFEIFDETGDSYTNFLIYNNSFGEILWLDNGSGSFIRNLTLDGIIGLNTSIFIGENISSLNTSAFNKLNLINSSANITMYGLELDTIAEIKLFTNFTNNYTLINESGTDCIGNVCTNLSYTGNTLVFNVTSFGSFGPSSDGTNPNLLDYLPLLNSVYNISNTFDVGLNVTDNVAISRVFVNISYPNGTINNTELEFDTGNRYNITFTAPIAIGDYNITYIVNDTSGNVNEINMTNFTVNDIVTPSVDTLVPAVNSVFNVSNIVEINATITDDVNVNYSVVNITYPNGTIEQYELTLDGDNIYNTTFTAPALIGLYNITFLANDSSNNLNDSSATNFTVNDIVNPTILDFIPALNSEYNTLDTIEIAVNVTDDVNVSQVFANVSLANETIEEVELIFDTVNRYNNTYTIPVSVNGTYNITFIANDTTGNYNTTNITNFTAVSPDTDGDGIDDNIDTLMGNESDITSQGVPALNITVGGTQVSGTFTGEQEVLFFNDSLLFVNFTHNFSSSGLNLSNFTINFRHAY